MENIEVYNCTVQLFDSMVVALKKYFVAQIAVCKGLLYAPLVSNKVFPKRTVSQIPKE